MACVTRDCLGWLTRLQDAGVVPKETRRIIIDIPCDGIVRVYYECNADECMFTIDMAKLLEDAEPIGIADCKSDAVPAHV